MKIFRKNMLVFLLLAAGFPAFCGKIVIAQNGKATADIVIPENAKPLVKFAAKELKTHLDLMTGADFSVVTKSGRSSSIRLGFGNAEDFAPDEFAIESEGNTIEIYGKDSTKRVDLFNLFYDNPYKGTLSGTYAFLDSLGVRWTAPGSVYTPETKCLAVSEGSRRFKPFFRSREITGTWNFLCIYPDAKEYTDNVGEFFLWGIRNGVSTRNLVPGAHSEQTLALNRHPERLKDPDCWKLGKDGKRNKNYSCWTSPSTKRYWLTAADAYFAGKSPGEAGFNLKGYLHSKWPFPFFVEDEFMIDPMDHSGREDGRCYCKRCEAFRRKYPCSDDTEIIWSVIADVAEKIGEKYPGKYISTLVYPPKREFPKYVKIPKNVRVRIALTGPRDIRFPNCLSGDLALLKQWTDVLGRENIPLWCYQCITFGRGLPGIPDTYPHLIADYLRKVKPLCAGMFLETNHQTHTYRNLDVYIFLRMAYDPSRNVDQELADYFRAHYRSAAKEAQAFFQTLENNWHKVDQLLRKDVRDPGSIGIGIKNKEEMQKLIWSRVYTQEEIRRLSTMLADAEKAAGSDPAALKHVRLLSKWLLDIMKSERGEVMNLDDLRKNLKLEAFHTDAKEYPSDAEWNKAKKYSLSNADRNGEELVAGGSFRMLASRDTLFIRADLMEPEIENSMTNPERKFGNPEIWMDNCVELFFYATNSKRFWQIIINDRGVWSSQTRKRILLKWVQMPGLRIKSSRQRKSWTAEIAVPLAELNLQGGELRFNLTRERNIKGGKTEFSSWSPVAKVGNWHNYNFYAAVLFQ